MRLIGLNLKILFRTTGLAPVAGLLLWCVVVGVQEPTFFRRQGLDLAWPGIYAGADIYCLGLALTWAFAGASDRLPRNSVPPYSWHCGWAALAVACLAVHGLGTVGGIVLDAMTGAPTPWPSLLPLLARAALAWLPMAVLAAAAAAELPVRWRAPVVVAAFAATLAIQPVSLPSPVMAPDKLLASALALAGGIALTRHAAPGASSTD